MKKFEDIVSGSTMVDRVQEKAWLIGFFSGILVGALIVLALFAP